MNPQDDKQMTSSDDTTTTSSPAVTPVAPQPHPASPTGDEHKTTPGILVLQWLSYAFWGWTLLALSVLIFIVMFNFINHSDSGDTSFYALAAMVILLPISLVCDFFYQKHELQKKTGVSMAVMVIHAVIFALFAIGTLIASLFSIVQLIINNNSSDSTNASIALFVSLLIVAVLYGITFFRTLNPLKSNLKVAKIYSVAMLVVAGVFTILAFVGPFAQTLQTKNDRLIESNLTYVESAVSEYVKDNKKLPSSLSDVSIDSEEAQQLLSEDMVTYKQDTPEASTGDYRYQLCVTYKLKDNNRNYGYTSRNSDSYSSYVNTTGHPAGNVCYKLTVDKPRSGIFEFGKDTDVQNMLND